ncbi:MAG: bifunctional 3,4-dihydroxy-2-butanone-4-phosphate synthase/GTP cyclohydrolase II [Sulfurifustaceae bacterium]
MPISPISEIVEELRQGRIVVLMDDADRENEGDLVIAAEHVTPEAINFMAKHGRGLICMPITVDRARRLNLGPMVPVNRAPHGTNFAASIEAAEGVTTGISAHDRAHTVRVACAKDARPEDLVQPGHVFPLIAEPGGVLARAGHTEACCDLARLAGFEPAAVLCEIMNDDGTMARLPELEAFAAEHGLKIGTIADLIRYRMEHESNVRRVSDCWLPTEFGEFRTIAYHDHIGGGVHLALVKGEPRRDRPTLVRVHVQESLLDLVTTVHRAGTWSLRAALARVARESEGVVVVLQQAEAGEDLLRRLRALQGHGETAESPLASYRREMRTYGLGSQILADLGVGRMRVLGHAIKTPGLSGFGLEIVEHIEEPASAGVEELGRERARGK